MGERVCALLAGGGYAEQVAVPAGQLLPVPAGLSLQEAAALPEVACTVWSNVVDLARLRKGETLLVHGGGSGIGTFAIQLGKALGATVVATARAAKHDAAAGARRRPGDRLHERRLRRAATKDFTGGAARTWCSTSSARNTCTATSTCWPPTGGSRSSACRAAAEASSTWAR